MFKTESNQPAAEARRRWRAVLRRDIRYDGRFVYAVRSTGIYCRPSCASRRPRRKHVEFYLDPEAAERAGFRACRRCHPRLFEELREKERLDEELKIAAAVQARLRPTATPVIEGWELAGFSIPCRAVGGDYYDFIQRAEDGRVVVTLGDVAGKGAGAALLMSSLHAAVRAQVELGAAPEQVARTLNRYIYENSPTDKFVTLFYAELDPASGRLAYVNAGHPPPLWARGGGEMVALDGGAIPLGIVPEVPYRQQWVTLAPGDTVVLYSDGISECGDNSGQDFGEHRLAQAVAKSLDCPAGELCQRLREETAVFADGAPARDDQALVVLRRGTPRPRAATPAGAELAVVC